jgi:hypothetical protein
MFFPIGFTLQDFYRISFYRICFYELNNMCRKFSYRIQIIHYFYAIPMNQRSPPRRSCLWLDVVVHLNVVVQLGVDCSAQSEFFVDVVSIGVAT